MNKIKTQTRGHEKKSTLTLFEFYAEPEIWTHLTLLIEVSIPVFSQTWLCSWSSSSVLNFEDPSVGKGDKRKRTYSLNYDQQNKRNDKRTSIGLKECLLSHCLRKSLWANFTFNTFDEPRTQWKSLELTGSHQELFFPQLGQESELYLLSWSHWNNTTDKKRERVLIDEFSQMSLWVCSQSEF